MSILSRLIHGQYTFQQAAVKFESWIGAQAKAVPGFGDASAGALADLKQAASDAVGIAGTAIAPYIGDAVAAIETAVDGALLGVTGGKAAPLIPLVNDGIDKVASIMKAAIDAKVAEAKANLANLTPTNGAIASAPVANPPAPDHASVG